MMNKKIIIPVLIVLAAAAVVLIVVVSRHRDSFLYAGTVEATEVDIPARVAGIIKTVNVREGDIVKEGDLLAELKCEDIELAAEIAGREFTRAEKLLAAGSIGRDSFDKIKYRYNDASLKLSWCRITAPSAGTVLARFREPGEFAAPGTKILRLADLRKVWAYIYVDQPVLSEISPGMDIYGTVPESDIGQIDCRVAKINEEAEFTPKNVQTQKERTRLVYGVKVEFDNPGNRLKPGMTVEVRLPEK